MKEFLENQMWFVISCKLKKSVLESQGIILRLNERFNNENTFHFSSLSKDVSDAFSFFLDQKKILNNYD